MVSSMQRMFEIGQNRTFVHFTCLNFQRREAVSKSNLHIRFLMEWTHQQIRKCPKHQGLTTATKALGGWNIIAQR